MRYDKIAQGIVDLMASLRDSKDQKLFGICRIYDGEFEQPERLPEQYEPGTTYCLVEPRGTNPYKNSESNSQRDLLAEPQIILFIGSHTISRKTAIQEVYERLDRVHDAIHLREIKCDGKVIGVTTLINGSDAKEFGMPNKACWSLAVVFRTRFTIS